MDRNNLHAATASSTLSAVIYKNIRSVTATLHLMCTSLPRLSSPEAGLSARPPDPTGGRETAEKYSGVLGLTI